jgi:outer membrane protein OmpA-like peptidoglycan-associated protein
MKPTRNAVVYFELRHFDLVTSAGAVADAVADRYRTSRGFIVLVGSTDRSGKAGSNLELARKRAEGVAAALRDNGFEPYRIIILARTESAAPVATSDGVTEPENRRVDIYVR